MFAMRPRAPHPVVNAPLALPASGELTATLSWRKEVRQLAEDEYRKWMVRLAVATLLLTAIRLWIRA